MIRSKAETDIRDGAEGLPGIGAKAIGALIAFAAGDALGWPQEMPANKAAGSPDVAFRQWTRRAGGRFYHHLETIRAGEYSDDTQLLLAVARARLTTPRWVERLALHELPLFTVYERGAGRAVLRACRAWRQARPPWLAADESDREAYFEAGANGVAMRAIPHALWHHRSESARDLAADVMADGVLTHGHPRALVGAIVYATAAWILLRKRETLAYGELIDKLLRGEATWAEMPSVEGSLGLDVAPVLESIHPRWQETVHEVRHLLMSAREGLERGALGDDRDVLERLGCFTKTKGSGTVTAVAAIYLASRYAAQPRSSVLAAAFATGADTDTLGAMTGGLVGAIAGSTWMPTEWQDVQDSPFLADVAMRLAHHHMMEGGAAPVRELDLDGLVDRLQRAESNEPVPELGGRVVDVALLSSKERQVARLVKIASEHGQTFYVKRMLPKTAAAERAEPTSTRPKLRSSRHIGVKIRGVQMVVRDVHQTARFYEDVLGLRAALDHRGVYVLDGMLELLDARRAASLGVRQYPPGLVLVFEAQDVYGLADRLEGFGVAEVVMSGDAAEEVWVRFRDPNGNQVEIREAREKSRRR